MKYCSPLFGCFVPMHLTNNIPRSNIEPFLHNHTPLSAPNRFPSTLVCVVNTHQSEWKSSFSIRTGLRSGNTRGWMSTKMQTKLKTNGSSNEHYRASLMVQWLRICLAVQGTPVWSLIQEDPTCLRVINPGTTTTCSTLEPVSCNCWNPSVQRSHCNERLCTLRERVAPASLQIEKAHKQQQRSTTAKKYY